MSFNTFGHLFRVTTWGESHGPGLGCVVDGCPPGIALDEAAIQNWLDRRKPGTSKFVTQRREADQVKILSGVFEGESTGTPIHLMIENTDQRSKDYGDIKDTFRPGHADYTYFVKYGRRDYRGGGRSSARETAARVAAGGVARAALDALIPGIKIRGALVQIGTRPVDFDRWDWAQVEQNPFWCPDAETAKEWEDYLDGIRKDRMTPSAPWSRSRCRRRSARPRRADLRQARHRSCGGDDVDQRGERASRSARASPRPPCVDRRMPTRCGWAIKGRASDRTMRAAFSAASRRGRTSSCVSR